MGNRRCRFDYDCLGASGHTLAGAIPIICGILRALGKISAPINRRREEYTITKTSNVLQNRVVQFILLSGLFVQIGIWVRNFAILLFVVDMTGSDPFAVSMISVAEFAPIFIFSFIGGTFADRWPPKRTMIWCEVLSALSVFAVLGALVFAGWKAVFFVTLVSAVLSQFSQPSGLKLFKMHLPLEQIQIGMSVYQTMFAVFMVFGPMLGTLVYQRLGIYVAIGVMGVAFLLSAAALCFLPPDHEREERTGPSTLRQEMTSGIRYVLGNRILILLSVTFLTAGLALGLTQPLGIFLVTEQLNLPKEYIQWLLVAYGGGMVLGGLLAMSLSKKLAPQKMLAIGTLIFAIGYSAIGWSKVLWLTLIVHFVVGAMLPSIQIGINTMMLQNTEEAFVGRVNGIFSPLFFGSMVLTMSIAGALKHWFTLTALYGAAALLFVIGLAALAPIYHLPRHQSGRRT